jgi:hypothetical protein
MPKMDAGPTDGPRGRSLSTVWVTLTPDEAADLLDALREWAEEREAGLAERGWHAHVSDADGNELTLEIAKPS